MKYTDVKVLADISTNIDGTVQTNVYIHYFILYNSIKESNLPNNCVHYSCYSIYFLPSSFV